MLNPLARGLLVLTSLAPIAIVYGFSVLLTDTGNAGIAFAISLGLVLLSLLLLRLVQGMGEREELKIARTKSVDKEILPFLVSYLLPLLTYGDKEKNALAIAAFITLLGLVLFQTQLLHVNPLLGMLRYRFHEVITQEGVTYLILTKQKHSKAIGSLRVARISDHVFLELPPEAPS